jgi:hypothetical protein
MSVAADKQIGSAFQHRVEHSAVEIEQRLTRCGFGA